jgi:hypothetical protein
VEIDRKWQERRGIFPIPIDVTLLHVTVIHRPFQFRHDDSNKNHISNCLICFCSELFIFSVVNRVLICRNKRLITNLHPNSQNKYTIINGYVDPEKQ